MTVFFCGVCYVGEVCVCFYDDKMDITMRPAPDWKGGVAGGGLPVLYLAGCKKFTKLLSAGGRL